LAEAAGEAGYSLLSITFPVSKKTEKTGEEDEVD
jgi:hypothetical protein